MNITPHKDILTFLQQKAEYNFSSSIRRKWLENYNRNEQYVRGNQWLNDVLNKELIDIGAIPFTLNKINSCIEKYKSLFVKATKRINFAPTTNADYDRHIAELLKYWGMNLLTQNQHPYYSQLKSGDMLKSGLGWSQFYYDQGKYIYEFKNGIYIYSDPDDLTPRMTNQNCIVSTFYVDIYTLLKTYKKSKTYLKS